jgi:hypothetical protein
MWNVSGIPFFPVRAIVVISFYSVLIDNVTG